MEKSKILQIVMIAWILLFVAFAVYKLTNAPVLCWDSFETDPLTGEIRPIGGCNPEYGQAIAEMILPFIIWMIILIIILVFYLKSKK